MTDQADRTYMESLREMQDQTENELTHLMDSWVLDRDERLVTRIIDRLVDWRRRNAIMANRKLREEIRESMAATRRELAAKMAEQHDAMLQQSQDVEAEGWDQ